MGVWGRFRKYNCHSQRGIFLNISGRMIERYRNRWTIGFITSPNRTGIRSCRASGPGIRFRNINSLPLGDDHRNPLLTGLTSARVLFLLVCSMHLCWQPIKGPKLFYISIGSSVTFSGHSPRAFYVQRSRRFCYWNRTRSPFPRGGVAPQGAPKPPFNLNESLATYPLS